MPVPNLKNRVGMSVSGTPGTGPITLNAADAGYQSFAAAYGADANVDILIVESSAWEVARDCAYTHSGTTLSRGSLEASSTGSALSLTSAAKVYVTETATRMTQQTANINSIDGLLCGYSASTTAAITAGYCWIEGVRYYQASATTLSLSSGNEIGGSSIAADKLLYIYAYNNAGSIAYKWDLRNSTGDDPVWSEEWQYWYHPSNGVSYRLIGVMRTLAGSAVLDTPDCRVAGRRKRAYLNKTQSLVLDVTGTTESSLTLAGYVPKNGTKLICYLGTSSTIGGEFAQANFAVQTGTPSQIVAKGWAGAGGSTILFGQNTIVCASTDSIYAAGSSSTNKARVFYIGFEYEV